MWVEGVHKLPLGVVRKFEEGVRKFVAGVRKIWEGVRKMGMGGLQQLRPRAPAQQPVSAKKK